MSEWSEFDEIAARLVARFPDGVETAAIPMVMRLVVEGARPEIAALRERAERAEAEVARLTAKVNTLGDAVEEEGRRRRKAESADWNSVLLYRAAESRAVKAEGRAAGFECDLLSAREALRDVVHACQRDATLDEVYEVARRALSPSPKGTPP